MSGATLEVRRRPEFDAWINELRDVAGARSSPDEFSASRAETWVTFDRSVKGSAKLASTTAPATAFTSRDAANS